MFILTALHFDPLQTFLPSALEKWIDKGWQALMKDWNHYQLFTMSDLHVDPLQTLLMGEHEKWIDKNLSVGSDERLEAWLDVRIEWPAI